jgi:DNA-binding response OmpR family regulator
MKILVVDDEYLIRDVIKEYLVLEHFTVDEAENGVVAVEKALSKDYDLIVMDIMMPKKDGIQAVKEIKEKKEVPFIVLSARNEEYDKLAGFELGIDDYVTKPFSPRELVARIKAILKRTKSREEVLKVGELVIDDRAHNVLIGKEEINLTPKEYALLKYFVMNNNIAVSREQLLSNVWSYDFYGDDRTVDTHIKTLRKNLGPYGKFIKTVRGIGYKFEFKEEEY